MDAAVVSSASLPSFLVPSSTNESQASTADHNSNATSDEDVVQATSALLQDLDQASGLAFSTFVQASSAHTNRQLVGLPARAPYSVRKDLSPFSQSFLGQNIDGASPRSVATDGATMTSEPLPQHASFSTSPDTHESPTVDPNSIFSCSCSRGNVQSVADIEAVFSEALQDTLVSQYLPSSEPHLEQASQLFGQSSGSPDDYQAVHQVSVSALSMPEANQNMPVISINQSTGFAGPPITKPDLQNKKANVPPPPKKPLSPYMRFSKGVWQQVKAANPGMSVCEVGATIGRIWRELSDADKQHFIDEFNTDKAKYDGEFQNYLKLTGLQASDLVKPRGKKKDAKEKQNTTRASKQLDGHGASAISGASDHLQSNQDGMAKIQGQLSETVVGNGQLDANLVSYANGMQVDGSSSLPSFSQVWSNSEFMTQELLNDLVLSGQTIYQQQQVEAGAQRISVDGSTHQVATSYSEHATTANHPQLTGLVLQTPSSAGGVASDSRAATVASASGQPDAGTKGWPWQQVGVTLQNSVDVAQTGDNVLVYRLAASSSSVAGWQTSSSVHSNGFGNQSDPSAGQPTGLNDVQLMSTIHGQFGSTPVGANSAFQLVQNTVAAGEPKQQQHTIVVDQEKLQLRNALLDKSEEVLRLMKELEQAYSLIHQLKQQNDFFHQQWNLHHQHQPTKHSSSETDATDSSAHCA